MHRSIRFLLALALSCAPALAAAQSFPSHAVKIIVPYGPGGISDLAARILSAKLSVLWKQSIVVENRTGGAGLIGSRAVAKAAPDGYTLLVGTVAEFTIAQHLSRTDFDPQRDLAPVVLLTDTPLMVVANAAAPYDTVAQLVAASRSQPSGLSFASPGTGTLNHLVGERFAADSGAKLVHIPYKGGAQAALAVVAGEVPLGVAGVTVVKAHIESGKVKAIGVASSRRLEGHPDWPTLAEAGLGDFTASNWVAMAAPAGTPVDVISKINADVNAVLAMKDVREQLVGLDAQPVGGGPEVLAKRSRVDSERYGGIVRALRLTID